MASATTTIRVSRATHDALAAQAHARRIPLSTMLADIAEQQRRASVWQSEREASRVDAGNPEVRAETRDWDSAGGDGIA